LVILALGVAGCGDSPHLMVRDLISFRNELADEALRVTDDTSAKWTREGRFKKMKDRLEYIKARIEKIKDSRKQLTEFFNTLKEHDDEMKASAAHLARAKAWLQSVGGDAATMTGEMEGMSNPTLPQPPPETPPKSSG
jgi:hypothetical protein